MPSPSRSRAFSPPSRRARRTSRPARARVSGTASAGCSRRSTPRSQSCRRTARHAGCGPRIRRCGVRIPRNARRSTTGWGGSTWPTRCSRRQASSATSPSRGVRLPTSCCSAWAGRACARTCCATPSVGSRAIPSCTSSTPPTRRRSWASGRRSRSRPLFSSLRRNPARRPRPSRTSPISGSRRNAEAGSSRPSPTRAQDWRNWPRSTSFAGSSRTRPTSEVAIRRSRISDSCLVL